MFLSALQCTLRRTLAVVLACTLTATAWSQNAAQPNQSAPEGPKPQRFTVENYTKARSHFPNPIAPYRPQYMPAPDLSNTPRVEQLLRDGKLYLSMNDAVALAMENNLDIAIQRYNLNIADTDILRASAGGSTLGVNSGTVSGNARRRDRRPQRIGRLRHRRHQRGLGRRGNWYRRTGQLHLGQRSGHHQL